MVEKVFCNLIFVFDQHSIIQKKKKCYMYSYICGIHFKLHVLLRTSAVQNTKRFRISSQYYSFNTRLM